MKDPTDKYYKNHRDPRIPEWIEMAFPVIVIIAIIYGIIDYLFI